LHWLRRKRPNWRRESGAEAQAEKNALIEHLSKPSSISEEEAIGRAIKIIERAMKNRITEVEVFRFPNQFPDGMPGDIGMTLSWS
jgi:hypothetical protein